MDKLVKSFSSFVCTQENKVGNRRMGSHEILNWEILVNLST